MAKVIGTGAFLPLYLHRCLCGSPPIMVVSEAFIILISLSLQKPVKKESTMPILQMEC